MALTPLLGLVLMPLLDDFFHRASTLTGSQKPEFGCTLQTDDYKYLLFIPFGIVMLILSSSGFNCLYVSGCLRVLLYNDSQVFLPDLVKYQVL